MRFLFFLAAVRDGVSSRRLFQQSIRDLGKSSACSEAQIVKPESTFRFTARVLPFLLAACLAGGQQPVVQTVSLTAGDIMARVAANQDRSETLRKEYIYKQHIHIATRKQSKLMREENADYDVVPLPEGTQKRLKSLTGRYWDKSKYVEFHGESVSEGGVADADLIHSLRNSEPVLKNGSTDADLIQRLRNDLSDDKSKDGFAQALFPLTSGEQRGYEFKLLGLEVEAGRSVYHISFTPRNKKELTWAGEAFIDAEDFQPVWVFTKMSRRIPLVVRTTWFDLPGFGFNVVYKRQEGGVWFPSSFGTEFQMHVGPMFFFNRDISIAVENSGFERRHMESK